MSLSSCVIPMCLSCLTYLGKPVKFIKLDEDERMKKCYIVTTCEFPRGPKYINRRTGKLKEPYRWLEISGVKKYEIEMSNFRDVCYFKIPRLEDDK